MDILLIQSNCVPEKKKKLRECFSFQRSFQKLGFNVDIFGPGHTTSIDVLNKKHDVVMILENYGDEWLPDISNKKSYKILWEVDAHYRGIDAYDAIYNKNSCHMILHATKEFVRSDHEIWFPNAYDADIIINPKLQKNTFLGFCGTLGWQERDKYLKFLVENWNIKLDHHLFGEDMINAIGSYSIHFNKNIGIDINYRNFETFGCGTLLLTSFNPNLKDLGFVHMDNCLIYDSINSANDCIRMLKLYPHLIEKIAQNGESFAKKHTYDARIKFLIDILKEKL